MGWYFVMLGVAAIVGVVIGNYVWNRMFEGRSEAGKEKA